MWPKKVGLILVAVSSALAVRPCFADDSPSVDLGNLSLEQLGDIHVTSVSKHSERLADAPASIYVITQDAIRRAGAHSLPEALRLAPNLQVAQVNAFQYAISARGFNSTTANKLLVLIDGRTVYTPLYSGVFWDAQDVLLQDIDRIEVISGPGGTLWGANAVNGVINIITKKAALTAGTLTSATVGNKEQEVALRHGGKLGESGRDYRVYAKADKWEHTLNTSGNSVVDDWERAQAGFRSDGHNAGGDLTVQGDLYANKIDQSAPGQQHDSGGNLLARWDRPLADGSSVRVQTYYDRTTRDLPGTYSDKLDTLDLDAQYSSAGTGDTQTIWGGGYRHSMDRVGNSMRLAFLPTHRDLNWANLFAQQERTLWPQVRATVGAKLEDDDEGHIEFLPNLKLAWKPDDDSLLWTSLSRAVRTPSRIDTDLYYPGMPPYVIAASSNFSPEILNDLDLGWRSRIGETLSYSSTVFYGLYDRLRSLDAMSNGTSVFSNRVKGRVYGLESWASWQATKKWSLDAGALLLQEHFSGDDVTRFPPGNDPHSQFSLRSRWDIGEYYEGDLSVRRVGGLSMPSVPGYTAVDARFGWQVSRAAELALEGRNLLGPHHQEFAADGVTSIDSTEFGRMVDITLNWSF